MASRCLPGDVLGEGWGSSDCSQCSTERSPVLRRLDGCALLLVWLDALLWLNSVGVAGSLASMPAGAWSLSAGVKWSCSSLSNLLAAGLICSAWSSVFAGATLMSRLDRLAAVQGTARVAV